MVDLNTRMLQAKGLAPADVVNTINLQNLILPSGTAKIGQFEYDVNLNAAPRTVPELNDLPIKVVGNSTIYLRDVANVRDGFSVQTNIVRRDGRRGTLLTVLKAGDASTLDVVDNIRAAMPRVATTLPPELKIDLLADQSIFVRGAISGVIHEAIIAACLTALMILLFLGSWRSTLIIAVSIPLSILTSVITLSFLGETINIMTLGGLALAVGILVDDATVTIENIERYLEEGRELRDGHPRRRGPDRGPRARLDPLHLHRVPAHVLPQRGGPLPVRARWPRRWSSPCSPPTCCRARSCPPWPCTCCAPRAHHPAPTRNPFALLQRGFERGFERMRAAYRELLTRLISRQGAFVVAFLAACLSAWLLLPWLGENFFPASDNGQFILHLRAKTGTRIEETARLADLVETAIRREIPPEELDNIIDNIGLPYSTINYMYSRSGFIGTADADILVTLKKGHRPTADHVRNLRARLPQEFPGVTFYFVPADIVTQILNFGLPAPIDVQIEGSDLEGNRQVANRILAELRRVPGLTDLRIQQNFDYPNFQVSVDRTKAAGAGFTPRDVANSMLLTLSGSGQTNPVQFLNWQNGVTYNLVTQAPQYSIQSLQDLQNVPISGATTSRPQILGDVASISRATGMAVISHYNTRRVVDIYGSVQDRDLGRGRPRHHPDRRRQPRQSPAARQLRDPARAGRDDARVLRRPAGRARLRDHPRLSSDRRELPVLARSLHHHHRAARRPRRHHRVPLPHQHHAQRAGPDGRDHVHGGGHRQQHPGGVLRQGAARRARRRAGGRHRGGRHPLPPGADDRARHDHRHDPDGPGPGRGRRAERPARARGHRRPPVRHHRHPRLRPRGVQPAPRARGGLRAAPEPPA